MKKPYLSFLFSLMWAWGNHGLWAQTPVEVSTQISPPYVPYLADYAHTGSDKLRIQLTATDFNEPQQQVWLKIALKGQGITIQQTPNFVPVPITLEPGVPYTLSGAELAPWLALENLSFTGMSQARYRQTQSLPEGMYELCVEVFDYRRTEVPLSLPHCVPLFISLYDPPRITNPMNGFDMTFTQPQLLNIQWLPMHLDGLNSGFDTEYEIEIFPIPEGKNANQAVLSETPILRERVRTTTFEYGPAYPKLSPETFYALRVRAIDLTNKTHFKNEGYSQVHTFQFVRPCSTPSQSHVQVLNQTSAQISWQGKVESNYLVQYRAAIEDAAWFEQEVQDTVIVVTDLSAGQEYEYRIRTQCKNARTTSTALQFFETPAPQIDNRQLIAECGQVSEATAIQNREAIGAIFPGQTLTLNGFSIVVLKAQAQGDGFQVEGKVFIPIFGKEVKVFAPNAKVNTDFEVYEGTFKAVRENMDSNLWKEYEKKLTPYVPAICIKQPLKNNFYPNGLHSETGELYGPVETQVDKNGNEVEFRYNQYDVDQYGFDRDGKYVGKEGKMGDAQVGAYDTSGFDQFGYYQGGDSKYNPEGYDRDGNRSPNMPLTQEESQSITDEDILKALEKRKLRRLVSATKASLKEQANLKRKHLIDRFKVLQREFSLRIKDTQVDSVLVVGSEDAIYNTEYVHEQIPNPKLFQQNRGYVQPRIQEMEGIQGDLWQVDSLLRHKDTGWETQYDKIKDLPSNRKLVDELRPLLLEILQQEGNEAFKVYLLDDQAKLKKYIQKFIEQKILPVAPQGTGFNDWETHELYASSSPFFIPFPDEEKKTLSWDDKIKDFEKQGKLYHRLSQKNPAILVAWLQQTLPNPYRHIFNADKAFYQEKSPSSWDDKIKDFEKQDKFYRRLSQENPAVLAYAWQQQITLDPYRRIFTTDKASYQDVGRKRSSMEGAVTLPIGYAKGKYVIAIDQIVLSPKHMYFDALMSFTNPENAKQLTFQATGVPLTKKGFQEAKLILVSDHHLTFGNKARISLISREGKTYAKLDCKGFAGFGIQGEIEFCSDEFIPVDKNGNELQVVNKEGQQLSEQELKDQGGFVGGVKGRFESEMPEWGEIVARIDMDPFLIQKADVIVLVENAYIDLSNMSNPRGIQFPNNYQHPAIKNGMNNLWRGVYIRDFTLKLPQIASKDDGNGNKQRTSVSLRHAIIDKTGFSGLVEYNRNILRKEEGNMEGGWRYSLNKIQIEVVSNQLKSGHIEGNVWLPITKEEEYLAYTAAISSDTVGMNYLFDVKVGSDKLNIPFWRLNVNLRKGSSIKVDYFQKKFYPYAILHGIASINTSTSDRRGREEMLAGLRFENLQVGALSPRDPQYVTGQSSCKNTKFSVGTWSFVGSNRLSMANFPVSIRDIGVVQGERNGQTLMGLKFTLSLNLMKTSTHENGDKERKGFTGETGLTVFGRKQECKHWKYAFLRVNHIQLEGSVSGVYVKGRVDFFRNDPRFGNGFRGHVYGKFGLGRAGQNGVPSQLGIEVDAIAQFGIIRNHRYGYVDALLGFDKAIPVAGVFGIYGFGGGFRFGMGETGRAKELPETTSTQQASSHSTMDQFTPQSNPTDIGGTFSGVRYLPDPKMGIMVKANVLFGTTINKDVLKGNAEFRMQFSPSGSLQKMGIYGYAYLLEREMSMVELARAGTRRLRAPMYTQARIEVDFVKAHLHFNSEAYLNMGRLVRGTGPEGFAGKIQMFFGDQKWFIHAGTPSNRLGVRVSVPTGRNREIGIETGTYLMIGHDIPAMSPLPERVAKYLNEPYQSNRNEGMMELGRGYAHGMDLAISSGEQTFLLVYGSVDANIGYDLLLKNYGKARCSGNSEHIGWGGWYAHGRVYSYLRAKLGIKINLRVKTIKAEILDAGFGTLLEAKLPNPFWMKGKVKGRYRVLGGRIKGKFKFQFEIGKQCQIVGEEALSGLEIISQITPSKGAKNISVFANPQVAFNFPINGSIDIEDQRGKPIKLRIKLDHFKIIDGTNPIQVKLEWNEDNDVLMMIPDNILPGEKRLTIEAKIHFQENRNGTWRDYREKNGQVYYETLTQYFSTGVAPDHLVDKNIQWQYPIPTQVNLYPKDKRTGFLQLKQGQDDLFNKSGSTYKAKFKANDGTHTLLDHLSYDFAKKRVEFGIPQDLKPKTIYHILLVKESNQKESVAVDENVSVDSVDLQVINDDFAAKQEIKKLNSTIEQGVTSQILYKKFFRTSHYPSLEDKLHDFVSQVSTANGLAKKTPRVENKIVAQGGSFNASIHILEVRNYGMKEPFSKLELEGTAKYPKPLIQFEVYPASSWFINQVNPLTYSILPLSTTDGLWSLRRTPQNDPPIYNCIYWRQGSIHNPYLSEMLTQENVVTNRYRTRQNLMFGFVWDFAYFVHQDYRYIQTKCANYTSQNLSYFTKNRSAIQRLVTMDGFPPVQLGWYQIKMTYTLPDGEKLGSKSVRFNVVTH